MRILYTITSYPPTLGGAQLHTHEIVRRFAPRHEVEVRAFWDTHRTDWLLGTTLFAPSQPHRYVIDGVPVTRLVLSRAERLRLIPYVLGYYAMRSTAIAAISPLLERQLEAEAAAVRAAGGVLHNCRTGREPLSFASLHVARRHGIPLIFVPYHHPRWVGPLYRDYLRLYREADALLALTRSEKETLISLGAKPERIFVTGIGPVVQPDAEGAPFRERHGIDPEVPLILFLGQKYRYKGLEPLLEATDEVWKRFPEAHFAFVGPRTPFSKKLFARFSDRRIIETGGLGHLEKSQALAACTLLCLPSSQESFGGVFTEAWSFGKPVIGADIPASREIIASGKDGLITPPTAGALAEAILQLLEHPSQAEAMGREGQLKTKARYDWEHLAKLTQDAYLRVLQGQPAD